MTIYYHGTPITPNSELEKLAGRCFCVSFAKDQQVKRVHEIGQSVMLDNGAFSFWRSGSPKTSWHDYYAWVEPWIDGETWAVIPDVIDGGGEVNDSLVAEWIRLFAFNGAPVWHMDEPINRLLHLAEKPWDRICFGSSGQYAVLGTDAWCHRMDEAWNELTRWSYRGRIHMLRGMQFCDGYQWPFSSVDSTDLARNHNRGGDIRKRADRWDRCQCPRRWTKRVQLAFPSEPMKGLNVPSE